MLPFLLTATKKRNSGQTLIGILIAIAVFSILAQAIFTVVATTYNFVSFNRARISARHLGQEKLELIRNLPYNQVGTVGGIPSGSIPQTETVVRNQLSYTIKTAVIYIDDPFDDTVPNDLLPTDYKRVRVEVSWQGTAASRNSPVVFLSDVSPKGIETTAGGGTLSILVFDASGNPVPQASVTIIAPSTIPPVNLTLQSGNNGRVILPGAPACISCYQITVTKSGYSTERTYSTAEVANPNKQNQTIIQGQLTEISFAIDHTSTLTIATKKDRLNNFDVQPTVNFQLTGQKTIGTDTNSQPVYKYSQGLSTDGSGTLSINNLEWDTYSFSLLSSGLDISGTNPYLPVAIIPNSVNQLSIALSTHSPNNLLVSFKDTSSLPTASVSATLTDTNGNSQTIFSGNSGDPDFGQTFFSSLQVQNYALTATASGFTNYTGNINVSGTTLETVTLNPQ